MQSFNDIPYAAVDDGVRLLDLHLPDDSAPTAAVVFFHGGGLEAGDRKADHDIFADATALGLAVASVEYRMYPGAKFPDYLEDAADAMAWVRANGPARGLPARTIVAGVSAGAWMAMMLRFDERYLAQRGIDPDSVAGWVFDAGQPTSHFRVLKERGFDTRAVAVDDAAPLFFLREPRNPAPMLFVSAEFDIPGRLQQTHLFLETLRQYGYPEECRQFRFMAGFKHCEYCAKVAPNGRRVLANTLADFAASLRRNRPTA